MEIFGAKGEKKLFKNCLKGKKKKKKKEQCQGLQKGQQNEIVKSNFLDNLYHNYLIGQINIYKIKTRV